MNVEEYRDNEISNIEEGEFVSTIVMQMLPQSEEYGFLDDHYDADGHSIIATASPRFPLDGSALVRTEFAQGTSPQMAASVLRKFADMLEGPQGHQIVNMGLQSHDMNYARRVEDDQVFIFNFADLLARLLGEGDDRDSWQTMDN